MCPVFASSFYPAFLCCLYSQFLSGALSVLLECKISSLSLLLSYTGEIGGLSTIVLRGQHYCGHDSCHF